jgi:hypothetical protein
MATTGTLVTKQTMVNDINALTTSKNNSLQWTSASNSLGQGVAPGWTGSSAAACQALLAGALTPVSTSQLTTTQVNASQVVTAYKDLAKASTRIRGYRLYMNYLWGNGCGNQDYRDFLDPASGYYVTAFTSAYEIAGLKTAIDNIAGPAFGDIISATSINNFIAAISTEANKSTDVAYASQCNRTACHCNCHTSCHASRARR